MGLIHVIGTGPGGREHITPEALRCIAESDLVIGYRTYLELIEEALAEKEVVSSQMMQEVQRGNLAFDEAEKGRVVAMISGGDPGIYAMAGLMYEIAVERDSDIDLHIVPGISALNGCASRLGAPLMHDFAVISLSDLLTPWERIEQRLTAAAVADFVVVLYNPKSKRRVTHIERAREILLSSRPGNTVVGIVTAATREHEQVVVTTLEAMLTAEITMQSTVIIGNSTTFAWRGRVVTPRGYARKYELGKER